MMPLPLPVRIAAGLVATAVEQVKELPRLVVEFPVTAVSQALQASMRVQQKVTELAIKGDRALGSLRPVEESPAWARFDDDELTRRNGVSSTVTELHPLASRPLPTRGEDTSERTRAPEDTAPGVAAHATATAAEPAAAPEPVGDDAPAGEAGPNALPGYGELTIPQLRAKLRTLDVDDLRALLAWETGHDARPPFVTMLTNRITTVTQG